MDHLSLGGKIGYFFSKFSVIVWIESCKVFLVFSFVLAKLDFFVAKLLTVYVMIFYLKQSSLNIYKGPTVMQGYKRVF